MYIDYILGLICHGCAQKNYGIEFSDGLRAKLIEWVDTTHKCTLCGKIDDIAVK